MGAAEANSDMKELVVDIKDQPGELNKITEAFGKAGVNIMAVALYIIGGKGRIHVVASDIKKGKAELEKLKYKPTTGDVLIIELKHSAGELARVTKLLAENKINIELVYGSGSTYPSAQIVIGVNDFKKASKVLGQE
jgi:hypothetical protein